MFLTLRFKIDYHTRHGVRRCLPGQTVGVLGGGVLSWQTLIRAAPGKGGGKMLNH